MSDDDFEFIRGPEDEASRQLQEDALLLEFGKALAGHKAANCGNTELTATEDDIVIRIILLQSFPRVQGPRVSLHSPDYRYVEHPHVGEKGDITHPAISDWKHPQLLSESLRAVFDSFKEKPLRRKQATISWASLPRQVDPPINKVVAAKQEGAAAISTMMRKYVPQSASLGDVTLPSLPTSFPKVDGLNLGEVESCAAVATERNQNEKKIFTLTQPFAQQVSQRVEGARAKLAELERKASSKTEELVMTTVAVSEKQIQYKDLAERLSFLRSCEKQVKEQQKLSMKQRVVQSRDTLEKAGEAYDSSGPEYLLVYKDLALGYHKSKYLSQLSAREE